MATKINSLTLEVIIAGHELVLETNNVIADIEAGTTDIQARIQTALANGVTFRMEKGEVIHINIGEFIDWVDLQIDKTFSLKPKLMNFFRSATNQLDDDALKGIDIYFRDLTVKAKKPLSSALELSFAFSVKVNLDNNFYVGIFGQNSTVTDIIKIESIGFGISYSS